MRSRFQPPLGDNRQEPQFGYRSSSERLGGPQEPYFENVRSSSPRSLRRRGRSLIPTFLVGAAIILFAGFVLIAYRHTVTAPGQLPIIAADTTPVKIKPDNPGGMDIPYQDTTVYDELARHGDKGGKHASTEVEHLLQPPEQPLPVPDVQTTEAASTPATPNASANPSAGDQAPIPSPAMPEVGVKDNAAALAPDNSLKPSNKLTPPPSESKDVAALDEPETPATKPAPQKAAATKPKAATGGKGGMIQLGAFRDEDSANAEWKRLQSRHLDELSPLSHTVQRVDLGDKGIWFRLKAGPIDPSQAKKTCATLKAANVSCIAY